MNEKVKRILVDIGVVVLTFLILAFVAYVPVQRALANEKYNYYSLKQEVEEGDLESKTLTKDFKNGGYTVEVKYKSDPGKRYVYHYTPYIKGENYEDWEFHLMDLEIFDGEKKLNRFNKVSYPPIEEIKEIG